METAKYLRTFGDLQQYTADRFASVHQILKRLLDPTISSEHADDVPAQDSQQRGPKANEKRSSPYLVYFALVEMPKSKRIPSHIAPPKHRQGLNVKRLSKSPTPMQMDSTTRSSSSQLSMVDDTFGSKSSFGSEVSANATKNTAGKKKKKGGSQGAGQGENSHNLINVGYCVAAYQPFTGEVLILDLCLRVPTIQQGTMEAEIIDALTQYISADMQEQQQKQQQQQQQQQQSTTQPPTQNQIWYALPQQIRTPWVISMLIEEKLPKWRAQITRMGFMESSPRQRLATRGGRKSSVGFVGHDGKGKSNDGSENDLLHRQYQMDLDYVRRLLDGKTGSLNASSLPAALSASSLSSSASSIKSSVADANLLVDCPVMNALLKTREACVCLSKYVNATFVTQ
jgi:hypothetical protein